MKRGKDGSHDNPDRYFYVTVNVMYFPPAWEQNTALLTLKTHCMAVSHFMRLKERSNSCSQTVSNTHNHTYNTYCCSDRNVLNAYNCVSHVLSLRSCNRAVSFKRSHRRIPEQVCEPNSATWTHWALQAQATQPLCKYSVLNIWRYTVISLASSILLFFCYLWSLKYITPFLLHFCLP